MGFLEERLQPVVELYAATRDLVLAAHHGHWSTFMKIISDGMNEKKYPADVRDEFLDTWRSFRNGVVQQ